MNRQVREHFERALTKGQAAVREGRYDEAWPLFERAHVLGQAFAGPHMRAHWAMLGWGWRRRDASEVVGQIVRLLVAAPASIVGVLPLGNTGGADLPMTRPMPISDELRAILAGEEPLSSASNGGKPHAPPGGLS